MARLRPPPWTWKAGVAHDGHAILLLPPRLPSFCLSFPLYDNCVLNSNVYIFFMFHVLHQSSFQQVLWQTRRNLRPCPRHPPLGASSTSRSSSRVAFAEPSEARRDKRRRVRGKKQDRPETYGARAGRAGLRLDGLRQPLLVLFSASSRK